MILRLSCVSSGKELLSVVPRWMEEKHTELSLGRSHYRMNQSILSIAREMQWTARSTVQSWLCKQTQSCATVCEEKSALERELERQLNSLTLCIFCRLTTDDFAPMVVDDNPMNNFRRLKLLLLACRDWRFSLDYQTKEALSLAHWIWVEEEEDNDFYFIFINCMHRVR